MKTVYYHGYEIKEDTVEHYYTLDNDNFVYNTYFESDLRSIVEAKKS